MVGSILGTFLTGFVLIDVLGTKGVLARPGDGPGVRGDGARLGLARRLGGHPAGPLRDRLRARAPGSRSRGSPGASARRRATPSTTEDALAWVDESNYYYIKVTNEPDADGQKRTLVLDNLIHGYFILGHPERLDYDYEHIYALVAHRVAAGEGEGGGQVERLAGAR